MSFPLIRKLSQPQPATVTTDTTPINLSSTVSKTKLCLLKIVDRFMIDPKLQMFKPLLNNAIAKMDEANVQKLIDTFAEILAELKQSQNDEFSN